MKNRVVLYFSAVQSEQPIIYQLIKNTDLIVNILKADISPQTERYLVSRIGIGGKEAHYGAGIKFLQDLGIVVEPLRSDSGVCMTNCTLMRGLCLILPHAGIGYRTGKHAGVL